MTDITAKATVYPSANDIAETEKEGRYATEQSHTEIIQNWEQNHIVSGFQLPASDPDLNISVPAGTAIIDGRRVVVSSATDHTLVASQTNHIWIQLSFDGDGNVDGVDIVSNTTGAAVSNAVKIGEAVTDGSSVTSTVDLRRLGRPFPEESVDGPTLGNIHLGGTTATDTQTVTGTEQDVTASSFSISREDLDGVDTKVLFIAEGELDAEEAPQNMTVHLNVNGSNVRAIRADAAGTVDDFRFPGSIHWVADLAGSQAHTIKLRMSGSSNDTFTARNWRLDAFAIGKG